MCNPDREAAISPATIGEETCYVVGIGASAGGLEALEHFFRAMPSESGMAFVVIQHLSPDFKSLMDELLARYTKMDIVRVESPTTIKPNTIYLLPPRKELLMKTEQLVLLDRVVDHAPSMPINRFFSSLAKERGDRAIGIVLSGTGTDGSLGIGDIHEAGGLVLVQSEDSSKFDGMPRSAIATGFVHGVYTPEEMPAALLRHLENPALLRRGTPLLGSSNEDLSLLFEKIRESHGIDFSLYKPATILRRIERRLVLGNFASVKDYCNAVFTDASELDQLYRDLLIGVTRFFRDPEAFDVLREKVIPEIVAGVPEEDDIRVWVPGGATGEEAYSLAMLFLQELELRQRPPNLKIFATDLHRDSLRAAAEGIYTDASLEMLPDAVREKYFNREADGRYRVVPRLRKALLVSPHNLIRDVPFNRIDLVSCRNLLIYFQPVAQTKALTAFHFALKPKGFLFLGPSESTGELERDFEGVDRSWKIFRKSTNTRLPLELRKPTPGLALPLRGTVMADTRMARVHDLLLSRFMPPGVLVNEKREVVHLFGTASRVLHPPEGRVSLDVVAMCDGELRMALSSVIQASLKRRERVEMLKVRVPEEGRTRMFDVVAEPVMDKPTSSLFVLVLLHESVHAGEQLAPSSRELEMDAEVNDHVQNLEEELKDTRESLQALVEELETTNEELQASNEELLASNEELQSTNEELHSVNEELYSVNAEHEQKIRELATTTSDLRNLIAEGQTGIIFTDQRQSVRLFTPGAAELLNLLPQDIGRPISHITSRIKDDDIFEDILRATESRQAVEKQVAAPNGRHYLRRIAPYHDNDKQPGGLVIAFTDITSRVNSELEIRRSHERVEEITFALNEHAIVAITDPQGKITFANDRFCQIAKYRRDELVGQDHRIVNSGYHSKAFFRELWSKIGKGEVWHGAVKNKAKDGSNYWVDTTIVPFLNEAGKPRQFIRISADITNLMEAGAKLEASVREKEVLLKEIHHRVKNNLQVVASILQLQSNKFKDAKYREMFAECQNRIHSMALIHEKLYSSQNFGAINFAEHIQSLGAMVHRSYAATASNVQLQINAASLILDIDRAIPASLILNELMSNAMKHGFPNGRSGRVEVTFQAHGEEELRLSVADDGVGLPEDFQQRSADTLGLQMIEGLARQLRGSLEVSRAERTCFSITFPANKA